MTQVLTAQGTQITPATRTFFEQHMPAEYADWVAKDRALHEAAGELQEAHGRLRAAELGDEDDEVRAIVGVRRAERCHAEAQRAAQAAWESVAQGAAHRLSGLMHERMHAYNERRREIQAAFDAAVKHANEQANAALAELMRWRAEQILPLVEIGGAEARFVQLTGCYAISE